jgi:hypothetical protein
VQSPPGPQAQISQTPQPNRPNGKPGKPNKSLKIINSGPMENFPEKTFTIPGEYFPKDDPLATQDALLESALEKARDQVIKFLHEQKMSREWKPSPVFVRDRLLVDLREEEIVHEDKTSLKEFLIRDRTRYVEETRTVGDDDEKKETRRAWVRVALNPENWKQIQKEIQKAEDYKRVTVMRSRMFFLVKFLAGIVALLGTVCGYLRLDEWSKGYYTKWLRLAAVGCVGAVTVFLWMLITK